MVKFPGHDGQIASKGELSFPWNLLLILVIANEMMIVRYITYISCFLVPQVGNFSYRLGDEERIGQGKDGFTISLSENRNYGK